MVRLLLIPTRFELQLLPDAPEIAKVLAGGARWRGYAIELIGFGPVDAGVGAMAAFARNRGTELAVLAGLCGSLRPKDLARGDLVAATGFTLDGVAAMASLPADVTGRLPIATHESATARVGGAGVAAFPMLTVCSASSDAAQVAARVAAYPRCVVEEMEGFAVARAARLAGVPLASLRAVSNAAGDRDGWQAELAMGALGEALGSLVG